MNIRAAWRAIAAPSLTRRLVLAQMLLLFVIWCAAITYFIYDIAFVDRWYEPKQMEERADMILAVMNGLHDRPAQLAEALRKIDEFQRDENRERDDPGVRVTMNAWFGDELVYRSPGEPGVMEVTEADTLESSVQYGRRVRTFAGESPDSTARVVLILPGDAGSVFLTLWASGIVLLPLLVSIPLLVVPAWLSVRIALRPYRELALEVAAKGPLDLEPLGFTASHAELKPIVGAINGLMNRLRAGISRERRFIADAAHELRTPLAAMRINIEALRERSSNDADRSLLDGLVRSGDRATRLAGQLLSMMRSDSTPASSHCEIRLDELVQDLLAELAGIARQRNVELEFTGPSRAVWIRGDTESLQSLVTNLVENAIKYSPGGGTVEVELVPAGQVVELSVRDHGPGIAPKFRETVLEPFFRVTDQGRDGNGLGLAIVKSVCDRLGADLSLDEAEGGGLEVSVRMPEAGSPRLSS